MHNKTELIERLAERFPQLLSKDPENAVNLIIDELIVALATGDRVSFQGFGSFETREVPKRTRTNPRNGAPVEVPAKRIVKFNTGKELRERCGLSEYLRERKSSWGNQENVGVDVLEKYSNHPDPYVIRAILENKNCTPELVGKIAGRMASSPDPVDRLTAASSGKSCPPELIRQLCNDKDTNVRVAAAEHCPADMFEVLARDKSEKVREALLTRDDLSELAETQLAKDNSVDIRVLVARKHRRPSVLSILACDADESVRRVVLNQNYGWWDDDSGASDCPDEILRMMTEDASIAIRQTIAKGENCPEDVCVILAADSDANVRMVLAENDSVPESVITRLASDPDKQVRERVAGRCDSLNAKLMNDLACDAEPDVRRSIGSRDDCPVELLQTLAIDLDFDVRCAVAANEVCPTDLLRSFVIEPDPWIRKLVGGNTVCPSDLLAMLATDESDDVREAVADNKKCPGDLLERLRHDKAPSVFGAALRAIYLR